LSRYGTRTLEIDTNIKLARLPTARGAAFDSHDDEHLSTCLPNTGVELQHQVMEWADEAHGKGIFWLSGIAGTGKSTIARTVKFGYPLPVYGQNVLDR
jgi:hypothetical protein